MSLTNEARDRPIRLVVGETFLNFSRGNRLIDYIVPGRIIGKLVDQLVCPAYLSLALALFSIRKRHSDVLLSI